MWELRSDFNEGLRKEKLAGILLAKRKHLLVGGDFQRVDHQDAFAYFQSASEGLRVIADEKSDGQQEYATVLRSVLCYGQSEEGAFSTQTAEAFFRSELPKELLLLMKYLSTAEETQKMVLVILALACLSCPEQSSGLLNLGLLEVLRKLLRSTDIPGTLVGHVHALLAAITSSNASNKKRLLEDQDLLERLVGCWVSCRFDSADVEMIANFVTSHVKKPSEYGVGEMLIKGYISIVKKHGIESFMHQNIEMVHNFILGEKNPEQRAMFIMSTPLWKTTNMNLSTSDPTIVKKMLSIAIQVSVVCKQDVILEYFGVETMEKAIQIGNSCDSTLIINSTVLICNLLMRIDLSLDHKQYTELLYLFHRSISESNPDIKLAGLSLLNLLLAREDEDFGEILISSEPSVALLTNLGDRSSFELPRR